MSVWLSEHCLCVPDFFQAAHNSPQTHTHCQDEDVLQFPTVYTHTHISATCKKLIGRSLSQTWLKTKQQRSDLSRDANTEVT